jgi:hypothetical protein
MTAKTSRKIIKHERANANQLMRIPNFVGQKELCNASTDDLRNALALLEYLNRCHRAALEVPGVGSALKRSPEFGIHCYDRAYCFVSNYLYEAKSWCEQRLKELEKPAICAS